jgi:hypothetical protein
MFGLAAFAAVAAMALVGATSAMATNTILCEEDSAGSGCPPTALPEATHVHYTTLTGAKAELLSSIVNVKCAVLYLGNSLGLAAPLVIHGNFTYSSCETEIGSACTATELSSSALINVLKTGAETGTVTGKGEVLVECGILIHCVYDGTGLAGAAQGSLGNGHVTITKQTLNKVSGFLCPKTATLDILTGSLTSLYIRE